MLSVIIEADPDGAPSTASLEVLAIAQELQEPVAVVAGIHVDQIIAQLASFALSEIVALEHPHLHQGASPVLVSALASWIRDAQPDLVLAPHSYAARDYVPRLAARLDRPLVTDCLNVRVAGGQRVFTRPLFQGRLVADVVIGGPSPHLATIQSGSASRDAVRPAARAPKVTRMPAAVDTGEGERVVETPFREAARTVDLSRADRIVAVGRGIQDVKHLDLVRDLAAALGAEVAASRPVCDAGWLPMDRQIGSSGQTVAPKLYVAVGISGAIQHIVGMRGARTIVAINKDPQSPILEIADYGIVGDLFEVIPALISALRDDGSGRA